MKKLITLFLVLALLLPAAASAGSLVLVQKYVFNTAPANYKKMDFEITGTIVEINYTSNKHMTLLITVEDEDAWVGNTYEYGSPCCKATMPYHYEFDPPFAIGDQITISGYPNEFYSTVMVPDLTILKINGENVEDWFATYAWGNE